MIAIIDYRAGNLTSVERAVRKLGHACQETNLAWPAAPPSRGKDADGTQEGYELTLTKLISEAVNIPVIASGGGGKPEHLYDVLTVGKADAALIASMVHYGYYHIRDIKSYLNDKGVKVRLRW